MRYHKSHKLESIVSKEPGRYAFNTALAIEGRAVATNGRVLAVVPIDYDEHDEKRARLIPREALVDARKATRASDPACVVGINGAVVAAGRTHAERPGDEFPDVARVLGQASDKTHAFVSLDAKLLRTLLDAITAPHGDGNEPITLAISRSHADKGPCYIVAHGGAVGAIMPLTVENARETFDERMEWARATPKYVPA